jgi:hypothetical protein
MFFSLSEKACVFGVKKRDFWHFLVDFYRFWPFFSVFSVFWLLARIPFKWAFGA